MGTIYCVEPGTLLQKEHNALRVMKDGALYTRIPFEHIDRLIVTARTSVSMGVISKCLSNDVPVHILFREGWYAGTATSGAGKNSPLRNSQYAIAFSPKKRLGWSKILIEHKIRNIRAFLSQRNFEMHHDEIDKLLAQIEQVSALDQLRGVEGLCSRYLFDYFRSTIPDKWNFSVRKKHPPPDPANAVISLCYSLLFTQVLEAVCIAGFDPYRGWFHETAYGHPAFVSDCCELYRETVADPVILEILKSADVNPQNFSKETEHNVQADNETFHKIISIMEARFETKRTVDGRCFSLRQWMREDMIALAQSISSGGEWCPTRLRR